MKLTVGPNNLVVSALGRWVVSGNSQNHTVKIVKASTGADLPGSSVSVSTGGATAGAFAYTNLAAPVTLLGGLSYYIVSAETAGGDARYNDDTTVTTTSDAFAVDSIWGPLDSSGVYGINKGAGQHTSRSTIYTAGSTSPPPAPPPPPGPVP